MTEDETSLDIEEKAPPKDATPKMARALRPRRAAIDTEVRHIGHDVDRRRKIIYSAACPACQLDDQKRRDATEPQVPDDDLYKTIFLIPDYAPERQIAELYLRQRYPYAENVGSSLNYRLVPQMPEIQVVVVCRRPLPRQSLTPAQKQELRADNKWIDVAVPHVDLVHEVLESAPIIVGDAVIVSARSLITEQQTDVGELVERLAEVSPGYRVFKQNPPDQLIQLMME